VDKKVSHILDTPIEFVKGVGPSKAETLQKELNMYRVRDLLFLYPFRYVDKTRFYKVNELKTDGDLVQLKGKLVSLEKVKGRNNRYRLTALYKDDTGFIELIWFQGAKWLENTLKVGEEYICYGKVTIYGGKKNIPHPEMQLTSERKAELQSTFDPVYPSTEKLDRRGLDSKGRRKLVKTVLTKLKESDIPENLPAYIIKKLRLCSRWQSIHWIHFPKSEQEKQLATNRIKFEEVFFMQLRMLLGKEMRKKKLVGAVFETVGDKFLTFYNEKLPFTLTGAQKRVLKEIRANTATGVQMNRLVQGDVGSGKTVVGFMAMLLAIDNGYQTCMMAPTQILAQQHYEGISKMADGLGITVAFLTGSVKSKKRRVTLEQLAQGDIDILIGTHALIEDPVQFKKLGMAIVDEQHRFGVAQRARLWKKNKEVAPHVLVMTATPIPRTLAMTVYGDLDVSVIDELPPGRKEIVTVHKRETARPSVIQFMHAEIEKGRQIYVVYPLIDESATLDLQNLNDGYERLLQYFPRPHFQMSIVHGRMKAADKDAEMARFVKGETQIMVATTVIEVGVNVPNASVMIIENTERFGLSQLHQLRGRVGRGSEQSYCILMSSNKISQEGRKRIATMVRTNDGFQIAEADLQLRGPGDIEGTMQSGIANLKLTNILQDTAILNVARKYAELIADKDSDLALAEHKELKAYHVLTAQRQKIWGRIS